MTSRVLGDRAVKRLVKDVVSATNINMIYIKHVKLWRALRRFERLLILIENQGIFPIKSEFIVTLTKCLDALEPPSHTRVLANHIILPPVDPSSSDFMKGIDLPEDAFMVNSLPKDESDYVNSAEILTHAAALAIFPGFIKHGEDCVLDVEEKDDDDDDDDQPRPAGAPLPIVDWLERAVNNTVNSAVVIAALRIRKELGAYSQFIDDVNKLCYKNRPADRWILQYNRTAGGLELIPDSGLEIVRSYIECDDKDKYRTIYAMHLLYSVSEQVYQMWVLPTMDPRHVRKALMEGLSTIRQALPDCKDFLDMIEKRIDIFDTNFSTKYYKDIMTTGSNSTLIESFFRDVVKTDADEKQAKGKKSNIRINAQLIKVLNFIKSSQSSGGLAAIGRSRPAGFKEKGDAVIDLIVKLTSSAPEPVDAADDADAVIGDGTTNGDAEPSEEAKVEDEAEKLSAAQLSRRADARRAVRKSFAGI